jgi:hypothetical protein
MVATIGAGVYGSKAELMCGILALSLRLYLGVSGLELIQIAVEYA